MQHDAFISYSRKDTLFARRLEQALERFYPPKGIDAPRRRMEIFRDEEDFTGSEYHESLDKHLQNSAKLIVLCSPAARASQYVGDEIRRFAERRGPGDIVPILVAGIPNNEAGPDGEAQKAFPEALCDIMAMPLAADYRGFDPGASKIERGPYQGSWFTVLANLYGVSRTEIEQREKKRRRRRRQLALGLVTAIVAVLASAGFLAWLQRLEADRQRSVALAGDLAVRAEDAGKRAPGLGLRIKALLAAESLRLAWTEKGYTTWREATMQMPGIVAEAPTDSVSLDLAFTPDNKKLVTLCGQRHIHIYSLPDLKELRMIPTEQTNYNLTLNATGDRVAAYQRGGSVQTFDVSRESTYPFVLPEDFTSVAFDGSGSLVLLSREDVSTAAVETGTITRRFTLPPGTTSAAMRPDAAAIVVVTPKQLSVLATSDGAVRWITPQPEDARVLQARFSGDSKHVITVSAGKTGVLDASTGRTIHSNAVDEAGPGTAPVVGGDLYLVGPIARRTSSDDGIHLSLGSQPSGQLPRYSFVSPTGRYVAAVSAQDPPEYAVFDLLGTGPLQFTLPANQTTRRAAFSADARYLALATFEAGLGAQKLPSAIQIVSLASADWPSMPLAGPWFVRSQGFAMAPSDNLVVVANRSDGSMSGYDSHGTRLWEMTERGELAGGEPLVVSPSGRLVARQFSGKGWLVTSLADKRTISIATGGPLLFSPDEKRVLISSRIYQLDRPQSPQITLDAQSLNRVWSRPGSNLAVAERVENGVAKGYALFDWKSNTLSGLPAGQNYVLSPDDARYAAYADDTIVVSTIGDPKTLVRSSRINSMVVDEANSHFLSFSPDGTLLAADLPGLTRIYDAATLQVRFAVAISRTAHVAGFSRDGKYLVTYVWHAGFPQPTLHPLTLDGVLAETCAKVAHDLTPEEWARFNGKTPFRRTCGH